MKLEKKCIIVTGGNGLIGQSIIKNLTDNGAAVINADLNVAAIWIGERWFTVVRDSKQGHPIRKSLWLSSHNYVNLDFPGNALQDHMKIDYWGWWFARLRRAKGWSAGGPKEGCRPQSLCESGPFQLFCDLATLQVNDRRHLNRW